MTRLFVEVLHEDGKSKYIRDATIEDVNRSDLLMRLDMALVPREFIAAVERIGDMAQQVFAPERVASKLREAAYVSVVP